MLRTPNASELSSSDGGGRGVPGPADPALSWTLVNVPILKEVNAVFSQVAIRQWVPTHADSGTRERPLVAVDTTLGQRPSVSLMHVHGGPTVLALSPGSATALGLADG